MKKPDLETRIADAFGAKLTSKELSDLLAEVAQADQEAKAASERASELALDPSTRPDAVAAARKAMEDADFRRRRFERATEKLQELKSEAIERERAEAAEKELKAAIAERDVLVKDLQAYADLSEKIAALLDRLDRNNRRLKAASVGQWVEPAEGIARDAGKTWGVNIDETLPRLLDVTRLPKFKRDGTISGYLWPKQ
ncbi:hypothetical protein [Neorhizobium petrolearium]|uniref:Uncharacterized protein n=1 Tax=Neorhizobium petrolearium TaxID=515361 RepID=A0ABY8LZM6_9HYPH|nr:hypothetical protein [Neorhizobium petrolearium]MCC2612629.1 hypothetical protein [Neorhizobium petrolearium]WGI67752.1 hypothetical protein QEO92_22645 [Neorhizobium petrolearium]